MNGVLWVVEEFAQGRWRSVGSSLETRESGRNELAFWKGFFPEAKFRIVRYWRGDVMRRARVGFK